MVGTSHLIPRMEKRRKKELEIVFSKNIGAGHFMYSEFKILPLEATLVFYEN